MRVAVKRAREVEARELEAMVAASAGMRVAVVKVRVAEVMAAVQTVVVMVHQWTPSLSMSLSQPRPS
jgi:hypothetical protein